MKSLEELRVIRERMQSRIDLRDQESDKIRVVVGMATCGIASGARPVLMAFAEEIQNRNISNVSVTQTGCMGLCEYEPIVEVIEPGKGKTTYVKMTPEKAVEVLEQHLIQGEIVEKYTLNSEKL